MTKINNIRLLTHADSFDKTNYVVTTKPNEYVVAEVDVPPDMPKEEIKKIRWVASTVIGNSGPNFTRENLHKNQKTWDSRIKVKMHEIFSGGGVAWIEPVFADNQPTNKIPNGFFVKSTGNAHIHKIEWREYSKDNNGPITKEKFYGQYAQLHVYTSGLYGCDLHLRLKDYKYGNKELNFDEDVDETNNSNLATELVRQVKIYKDADDPTKKLQKAVFKVYLEHRWMRLAAKFTIGREIEIGGRIAANIKGVQPFSFTKDNQLLLVKKKTLKDTHADPASKEGNKSVVIGNVVTDVAHFNPCRYEGIIKKYPETEDAILFSTEKRINLNQRILDIGVVATNNSNKKVTIQLEKPDVEHCHHSIHQKETVIDTTELVTVYKDAKISADGSTLTFTPTYPYQHIDPIDNLKFFTTYFPAFLPLKVEVTIPVKSCAFEKQIKVSVHPDVAFAMHMQIGKPEDFTQKKKIYYRNIDLENDPENKLVRGLKDEMKWARDNAKKMEKITQYYPNAAFNNIIRDIAYDYIEKQAEDIGVGLHGYHSFTAKDKATLINYAKQYEWIPKTIIVGTLIVSIAVDALIIYLTRGRSATAKAGGTMAKLKQAYGTVRKVRRYYKTAKQLANGQFIDPAKPNGVATEFIWPQISGMRGIGYVDQENGRVAVELVERIDAAPLFALKHEIKGSLGSMVASFVGITLIFDKAEQAVGVVGKLRTLKSAKKDIDKLSKKEEEPSKEKSKSFNPVDLLRFKDLQKFLDAVEQKIHEKIDHYFKENFGTDAKVEFNLQGFYSANYEFRFNILKKMLYLDIFEESGKKVEFSDQQQLTFGRDYGIDVVLKLQANSIAEQKWSRLNEYTPEFLGVKLKDTKTEAKIEGQIKGSLVFERTFKWQFETKQPTVRDTLIFTGIAGSLYMKVKVKKGEEDILDEEIGNSNLDNRQESTPITLELIPGFTINFKEQPIFEQSMWEYLIR
ncbi:hypothetical protein ACSTS3_21545 [Aquimarina muelleri]|uniref:hypothetical protein n=1 Tax=Aquimarina muelleri TaxID=279356 RepID=UPI003F688E33